MATIHVRESSWVYTLLPRDDDGTDVDLVLVRKGRNVQGQLAAGLVALTGKTLIGRDLRRTLRAIEQSG